MLWNHKSTTYVSKTNTYLDEGEKYDHDDKHVSPAYPPPAHLF